MILFLMDIRFIHISKTVCYLFQVYLIHLIKFYPLEYTFVFHPNFMTPGDFEYLDKFIKENIVYFKPVNEILTEINPNRKKSIYDHALYKLISFIRMIRSK